MSEKFISMSERLRAHAVLERMTPERRRATVLRAQKALTTKWTPRNAAINAAGNDVALAKLMKS